MNSQFAFLQPEFPEVHDAAQRAEALANSDPRAACFYARRALELGVTWAYEHDASLELPYREDLSALIHEPTFRYAAGPAVFQKCRVIKDLGNAAVHSSKPISVDDAVAAVRELFHFCYWLARTYAKGEKPEPGLQFDPNALPKTSALPVQTRAQIQQLNETLAGEREKLFAALADKESLSEELKKARAELAAIKAANAATPDTHDYSEEQTRDLYIDRYLKEAGWALKNPRDCEFEVTGMPNAEGKGYADYVLWGDDGKPLGVVEAKRTRKDPQVGQHQAKLYADCLEAMFGQRPVIFTSNGYEHWLWDDQQYPPRQVQGFYKKAELELMIQRRRTRRKLAETSINESIAGRYYQSRAIRRVAESFEKDHARRALLVMATGSGKTRTVIALADMLMKANWVKRVLFLADRTALVNQAVNAFKAHLPDAAPVNLVTEKNTEGRVYVSTYPTMIGLIDGTKDGERPFGPGHFDLIIVDEAHRSIFMKYRSIFDYFDSFLVGLTATPKDEVDRNTYRLFELEDGVPTDAYTLDAAVNDGYLVPAKSVSVPLKLPTQGITYDELSDDEKEQFDLTDWKERAEEVLETGRVEASAVNQWLFNIDTVDRVLKHLMERGIKVDGGDKLGKTILFAKNHDHAKFIAKRFNENYPRYKGHFAQVIDFKVKYAQSLIDDFSNPNKMPQIAISVDMLDTGIDVPEVVNLVFFKQVRSKTKFWQMVGRGTRLCPNLFGPGDDKKFFYIFDFCGNLEFFSQSNENVEGASGMSLGRRLFTMRLELLGAISDAPESTVGPVVEPVAIYGGEPTSLPQLATALRETLKSEVAAMNLDNFIVRAKRRVVEKYKDPAAWMSLDETKRTELQDEVAGLPAELEPEPVEAKRFDLLMLRLQVASATAGKGFEKMKAQVQELAATLAESPNIPAIREQMPLIEELQTESWWEGVTLPMLERVRLRLRGLMRLIEGRKGSPVFTDFLDETGEESEVSLPGFTDTLTFERFREKARAFLREQTGREAIQKLRLNEPLSSADLAELEAILAETGSASPQVLEKASEGGLGLFVRSLVGLDREAAKRAFNDFVSNESMSASQIEFVDMIIDYLTEHGAMEPKALYESPFTDVCPTGPDGLFPSDGVDRMVATLRTIRERATAV